MPCTRRSFLYRHVFFREHSWLKVQQEMGRGNGPPKVRDSRGGRLDVNRPRIPSGKHQAVVSTVYYGC